MGFFKKLFGGKEEEEEKIIERTLLTIQVGDIITYFAEDYEVHAVIEWMEEGYSWKEYKLKNREDSYWVSAEMDDGEIIASFNTVLKDFDVTIPPPKELKHDKKVYGLEEKGSAVGKITSKAGSQNYKMNYYEYECYSDETETLSIEDYGGDIEVSTGIELRESEIDILPGG